jgi:hypothetical protein
MAGTFRLEAAAGVELLGTHVPWIKPGSCEPCTRSADTRLPLTKPSASTAARPGPVTVPAFARLCRRRAFSHDPNPPRSRLMISVAGL